MKVIKYEGFRSDPTKLFGILIKVSGVGFLCLIVRYRQTYRRASRVFSEALGFWEQPYTGNRKLKISEPWR